MKFVLPIGSLKEGNHHYQFEIDDSFFADFEDSIIEQAKLDVELELQKRASLLELHFDLKGYIQTQCDRCLENMDLGIEDHQRMLVKYSESLEDDLEVSYIPFGSQELNVSTFIYEFAHLNIPITKTHEDIGEDCPVDLESFLEDEEEQQTSSVWDTLKDLKTD
ncbi:MAG: DUF177 domain-containing protein [Bacteroidota bacterium]